MRKMNAKAGAPDAYFGIAEDWGKDNYGSPEEPLPDWTDLRFLSLVNFLILKLSLN